MTAKGSTPSSKFMHITWYITTFRKLSLSVFTTFFRPFLRSFVLFFINFPICVCLAEPDAAVALSTTASFSVSDYKDSTQNFLFCISASTASLSWSIKQIRPENDADQRIPHQTKAALVNQPLKCYNFLGFRFASVGPTHFKDDLFQN